MRGFPGRDGKAKARLGLEPAGTIFPGLVARDSALTQATVLAEVTLELDSKDPLNSFIGAHYWGKMRSSSGRKSFPVSAGVRSGVISPTLRILA